MMPLSSRTCQSDLMIHVTVQYAGRLVAGGSQQVEVALHLAASPEQLVFGICKHSLSIARQSLMSNRRQLCPLVLCASFPVPCPRAASYLVQQYRNSTSHVQIRWIGFY